MKIIRSYSALAADERGASVALGNFDGVHLGHQSVIALARAAAADNNAPLGVITFEPHPRSFFAPDAPPFRLMNAEARANRLDKLGVDLLYELPFDAALAGQSADAFGTGILGEGLGVTHVVVGADFRFGKGRQGDADMLASLGKENGYGVTKAPLVSADGEDFSSTAIRTSLAEGRPADAARMLGHWHRIEGVVVHGEKRGRDLGYPTANLLIEDLHRPKLGIYAVTVDILTGPHAGRYCGAVSLGTRPTFGVNAPNLETFIFDFDGDLYGAHLSVGLVAYIREELKFDDLDALIARMDKDCIEARRILTDAGLGG